MSNVDSERPAASGLDPASQPTGADRKDSQAVDSGCHAQESALGDTVGRTNAMTVLPGETSGDEDASASTPHDVDVALDTADTVGEQVTDPIRFENSHSVPADTDPPIETPAQALPALVQDAWRLEQEQFDEDQRRLDEHTIRFETWQNRCERLHRALGPAVEACEQRLEEANVCYESWPTSIQEALANRQKAIRIVAKLTHRLAESLPRLVLETTDALQLRRVEADEWRQLAASSGNDQDLEQAIQEHLNRLHGEHWEVLSAARGKADKHHALFKEFITTFVLPPLDGLDDGAPLSLPIVKALMDRHPEQVDRLDDWYRVYGTCRDALLKALEGGDTHKIPVRKGDAFDDEFQEPVDTEPDPEMSDNQIKEIFRNGYRVLDNGQTQDRIRRTQVVVVRNR